jgi:hypothetical protein
MMIVNPDTFVPAMGSLVGASPCPADQSVEWSYLASADDWYINDWWAEKFSKEKDDDDE